QPRGADLAEDLAARLPGEIDVAPLRADTAGLGDDRAEFGALIGEAPERGADRHRGELAARVLVRPRHAGEAAIFLGQARIEHAAELDIAGRAAGRDDHRLLGADVDDRAAMCRLDADDAARRIGVKALGTALL